MTDLTREHGNKKVCNSFTCQREYRNRLNKQKSQFQSYFTELSKNLRILNQQESYHGKVFEHKLSVLRSIGYSPGVCSYTHPQYKSVSMVVNFVVVNHQGRDGCLIFDCPEEPSDYLMKKYSVPRNVDFTNLTSSANAWTVSH